VRLVKPIFIAVTAIGLSFPLVSMIDRKSDAPTDYEIELGRIKKDISEIKDGAKDGALSAPIDIEKATRYVHRVYQRALLTGSYADLNAAQAAIDRAIREIGPLANLYLLQANLDFRLHRVEKSKRNIAALSRFAGNAQIVAMKAGIAFQVGEYETAKSGYRKAIEKNPTWDNLARLAYWESKFGDPELADGLYRQAEEEISAKEMRSYAWVELERGLLDFNRGRYEKAMAHYRKADKAYSGYWMVEERMAELLGAERKFDAAAALYRKVIAKAPRPEFHQALGDLYRFMGKENEAKPWHDLALAAYLESAGRGEVHYYHHLAGFYADVRQDGAEAVKWARKDTELRPNFMTQDGLAWALYRNGQFSAALDAMEKTLSSGVKDSHLFFHAAMIHLAAGRTGEGKRFLQTVAEINPGYENFHVHR
jgi:tetratricopeptide (TPR) repeat protein